MGSEWTVDTLREHLTALREADLRALHIKEQADQAALGLSRDAQTYKDEKANELREQINQERHLYATKGDLGAAVEKIEVLLAPLLTFAANQQGRRAADVDTKKETAITRGFFVGIVGLAVTIISTAVAFFAR